MSDPFVELDLHGMTKEEARYAIEQFLKTLDSGTYQVRLIHGYSRGTELKNMILSEYRSWKGVRRVMHGGNQETCCTTSRITDCVHRTWANKSYHHIPNLFWSTEHSNLAR